MNILTQNNKFQQCDSLIKVIEPQFLDKLDGLELPFIRSAIISNYLAGNINTVNKYLKRIADQPQEIKDYVDYDFFTLSNKVLIELGQNNSEILRNKILNKEYELFHKNRAITARSEIEYQKKLEIEKKEYLQKENILKEKNLVVYKKALIAIIAGLLALIWLANSLNNQKKKIAAINSELEEKNKQIELFSREVSHRTKNQIALIANLITNQKQLLGSLSPKELIEDIDCKVRALAEVNKSMDSNSEQLDIPLKDVLETILKNNAYSLSNKEIEIICEGQNVNMDGAKSSQVALVINELSINSLKHAFKTSEKPHIKLEIITINNNLVIVYSDNGSSISVSSGKIGKGTKLIHGIVHHLDGDISESISDDGYKATIKIPNHD